ncbi:MAG TPA: hypothetical protein VNL77_01750 [Roseiflexaceae bacterium]|nr:hypothetical protein [Roseiflexaceae bacterium]
MPARQLRPPVALLLLALALCAAPVLAQTQPGEAGPAQPAAAEYRVYAPIVLPPPPPPNPFGFDLRAHAPDTVMPYVVEARSKWARAGDLSWAAVNWYRDAPYNWATMAQLDANITRLRQAGIEPMVIVQWSPPWAQSVPGRACSPPRPDAVGAFAQFMRAAAERYSSGLLQVNYWEIWNEPDWAPDQVDDSWGAGCWANRQAPYFGGDYYGQVLSQVYPAIKAGNPRASVVAGAFIHHWPDDTVTAGFLRGMFAAGAGAAFDQLSFHAYGEWGAGDLLVAKTNRLRQLLAEVGHQNKPLIATEIAVGCWSATLCPENFRLKQANYAARIYAQALALDLEGAFWYTLVDQPPGIVWLHIIDNKDGELTVRPAYYAFRNSAELLTGARYVGPALQEPPPERISEVMVLPFQKSASTLYVFWVPKTSFPKAYNLPVSPGARAICTDQLNQPSPARYDCSDANGDGLIPRAVGELPQYVEVFR